MRPFVQTIFLTALSLFLPGLTIVAAGEPGASSARDAAGATFKNPIITSQDAPDPWVVRHDGWYYFTATLDARGGLWIWKSRTLTGLDDGEKVKVWAAEEEGPLSNGIWAPELFRFETDDGPRWYLYFTADDGEDRNHRMYVLESKEDDPMGEYGEPIRVDPERDRFAIDATVLEMPDGERYFIYCDQGLEIVQMTSPTSVDASTRAKIAEPTLVWERNWIEAPEPLIHEGRVMLVYSAGHSATPHYVLGLLTLKEGGDPLDPSAWEKHPEPLLTPHVGKDGAIYTTGHNGFTRSPDGTEHWLLFHAKDWEDTRLSGFAGRRTHIQPFTFDDEGIPVFGHAIPAGVPLASPSGEEEAEADQ